MQHMREVIEDLAERDHIWLQLRRLDHAQLSLHLAVAADELSAGDRDIVQRLAVTDSPQHHPDVVHAIQTLPSQAAEVAEIALERVRRLFELRDPMKRPPDLPRPSSDRGDDRHRRPTLGTARPDVKPGEDRPAEVTVVGSSMRPLLVIRRPCTGPTTSQGELAPRWPHQPPSPARVSEPQAALGDTRSARHAKLMMHKPAGGTTRIARRAILPLRS